MKTTMPLTAVDLFRIGYWFRREGRLFQIVAWDAKDPLQVEARAVDDGTIHQFTLAQLFASSPLTRFAPTQAELLAMPQADAQRAGFGPN